MAFIYFNPNPKGSFVGDCVIRALSKATDADWYKVYLDLAIQGYAMCDMPSSNAVWGQYLMSNGYRRYIIPNTCPDCYTVKSFCADNPQGKYILATGTHVLTVIDGDYYDSWDSGNEIPVYYYMEE